ncbi:hypothetical protein PG994_000545 [Apiospora phragmitis]|uniref:Uncharacterized protein n=1 Tax=Apiospora phragmitis TaxID=2905665 RepID=A0ABR1X6I9_9PEZI
MPRDGSGRAHNAQDLYPETDHHIMHGAGDANVGDHVARAEKTAPMPEHEKGEALEGMNASGGTSTSGHDQGGRSTKN